MSKLTLEQFNALTLHQQESFFNGGGEISSDNNLGQVDNIPAEVPLHPSERDAGVTVFPPDSQPAQPRFVDGVPNYDGIMIDDPIDLLFMLDEEIAEGTVKLHDWQVQILLDFARNGSSDKKPYQGVVQAANGSGKDKYIIAACCVWLCMRYRGTVCPITSASGAQLDRQTCRYIRYLAEKVNKRFGAELWDIKYREYTLDFSKLYPDWAERSSIYCFATDEAKKAEGYHPNSFGAKMGIFVSEDKSIPDDINAALNKCTGYTHRLHVSTPGLPLGHFYNYCTLSVDRKKLKSFSELTAIDWVKYHVTAFDCPHISADYIEQMKRDLPGGEHGAAYKSQVLAEFGVTDEMVVIPYTYVWQAFEKKISHISSNFNTGGLDLSDGGDETVLVIRNGNKHIATVPFRFDNTADTILFLEDKFNEYELMTVDSPIYADCGGLGKPILDQLVRRGWKNIRYVDNRNTPYQPRTYLNRGAELWFHVRKLMECNEIILRKEQTLITQLSSRYYKINANGIHQLVSKIESRSKGYPSPDRADAFILAFWDYRQTRIIRDTVNKPNIVIQEDKIVSPLTMASLSKEKRFDFRSKNRNRDFSSLHDEINRINNLVKE